MRNLFLTGVAFAALVPASSAFAQAASTETSDIAQGDILITARINNVVSVGKSEALLIETPQSVSVVDRSFIETINTKTISESLG